MVLIKVKRKHGFRRRVLSVILPISKSKFGNNNDIIPASKSEPGSPHNNANNKEKPWTLEASPILLLPTELLRNIFSRLSSCSLQSIYETHPRFRSIISEHRSYLCKEIAARDLRYFARYLNPAWFAYQRDSLARISPALVSARHYGIKNVENVVTDPVSVPAWYTCIYKLDKVTKELYALMPPTEAEYENEYRRVQGLAPMDSPTIWPRPGWSSFYFTHTIIAFYQYNTLLRIPRESQAEFSKRGIKSVCRCAQGYFRSTAHLGMLCAVYMACLKFQNDDSGKLRKRERDILSPYLPCLGGGIGNYTSGAAVTVKELFKMLIVVIYPGNLVKVIKEPTYENMKKLEVVLRMVKEILVNMEMERRDLGDTRWYAKGLEMMEGFARHWEGVESEEDKLKLRYFGDWDELTE